MPPELLKLADFRGRLPKLPTLHMVREYMEEISNQVVWALDPAMPEAAHSGALSHEPIKTRFLLKSG